MTTYSCLLGFFPPYVQTEEVIGGMLTGEVCFMGHVLSETFKYYMNGLWFVLAALASFVIVACSVSPVEQSTWIHNVTDFPLKS